MDIYKTKVFSRWAGSEGLSDGDLVGAVTELCNGQFEASLGGNLYKKRVALAGRGKSGGARTLIACRVGERAFFLFGFKKNERDNIDQQELKFLKQIAKEQMAAPSAMIDVAFAAGELMKVVIAEKKDGQQTAE
mgnify:CR=1 FL=1